MQFPDLSSSETFSAKIATLEVTEFYILNELICIYFEAFDLSSRTTNNPLQMLLNLIIKQNYISGVGEVKSPLSLTIKKHSCTKNRVRKFLELENIMWCNSKLFIVNWFWYWSFADISTGLWGNFLPSSFFMNEHFRQVGGLKLKSKTSKHSRYRL